MDKPKLKLALKNIDKYWAQDALEVIESQEQIIDSQRETINSQQATIAELTAQVEALTPVEE